MDVCRMNILLQKLHYFCRAMTLALRNILQRHISTSFVKYFVTLFFKSAIQYTVESNVFTVYLGLMLYSVRSLLELSNLSDDVGYLKKTWNLT